MNKNEYSHEINKYITDYIKLADAKAATILTFLAFSLGGMFSLTKFILSKSSEENLSNYKIPIFILGVIILLITLIFTLITIFKVFKAIKPDVERSSNSLNSFPNINEYKSVEEYTKEFSKITEDDISTEYSKHNWEISNICMNKNTNLSEALDNFKLTIIGMVTLLFFATLILFCSYLL